MNTDIINQIWLSIPESLTAQQFRIENYMGVEDIKEPVVRGLMHSDDGHEVPFICLLVHLTVHLPTGIESGVAITTIFRAPELDYKWVATMVPGTKPSFSMAQYTMPDISVLKDLIAGETIQAPNGKLELLKRQYSRA